ncbi:helix-turn-helix domain-containing protein [Aliikangiella coralliicola]|uniref:Helix-turn-helix transcriptional regulator n=1 Tax=Aliikangiella coralliicola TaxID=2592383 RepID=A0A545UJG8_9GAMM|nr:AraC family transcriptional regulator [Aliikangiella coralliicola]TQV89583.1 helix-turn-helix transcriptional regulator [Aliikangiella coralliicola]
MSHKLNQILFSSSSIGIGLFDCPIGQPDFRNTGPIKNYLIAFPRTAIKIRHSHMKEAFIADSTLVTLYNDGQEYERYALSDYGDRCDWLTVSPAIAQSIEQFNYDSINAFPRNGYKKGLDSSPCLFPITHCASSPTAYAQFKYLIMGLQNKQKLDSLLVEETALNIFNTIIQSAFSSRGIKASPKRSTTHQRHQKLVQHTQEILTATYKQNISLANLAKSLNCSTYHLCRIYHRMTGSSIHQTINQLRLREALHGLTESEHDLASLGIQLGYSDHSHFSLSFRKTYGLSPSQFRHHSLSQNKIKLPIDA